jgi:hypothetical protein
VNVCGRPPLVYSVLDMFVLLARSVIHAIMNDEWTIAAVGRRLSSALKIDATGFVSIEIILHYSLSLSLSVLYSEYRVQREMGRTAHLRLRIPPIIDIYIYNVSVLYYYINLNGSVMEEDRERIYLRCCYYLCFVGHLLIFM